MGTISPIKTLEQLLKLVHSGAGYAGIGEMLEHIDFGYEEVKHLCKWSNQSYQKISLEKGDSYELILMCWESNQESPVHDHASGQGWIYVVSGTLQEILFYKEDEAKALEIKSTETIQEGKISYINDEHGIHKIINTNKGRTVSLHYYSDPSSEVNVYDELSGEVTSFKIH